MTDYSKAKIYRIVSDKTDLVYYGSTVQKLSERMNDHRKRYTAYKKGGCNYVSSFKILEEDIKATIVLVEDYPCERKEQLYARERFYIENNTCVNRYIPGRTQKEYQADNAEAIKVQRADYYQANAETFKVKQAEYKRTNAETIKVWKADYYKANIDAIKVKHAEYNRKNAETLKVWNAEYRKANEVYLESYNEF
jgi:hypothetical protein